MLRILTKPESMTKDEKIEMVIILEKILFYHLEDIERTKKMNKNSSLHFAIYGLCEIAVYNLEKKDGEKFKEYLKTFYPGFTGWIWPTKHFNTYREIWLNERIKELKDDC